MNDVRIVDMPADLQVVPLQQLAARLNSTERATTERLRALNVPVVKFGRKRGVFLADVARLITIVTGRPSLQQQPPGKT
jgi:hypothetical protein